MAPQLRKALEAKQQKEKKFGRECNAVCTYCGKEISFPTMKAQIGKKIRSIENSMKIE